MHGAAYLRANCFGFSSLTHI